MADGHPQGQCVHGPQELLEQQGWSLATSNTAPARQIPAESPWRLGESLALYRPAQPQLPHGDLLGSSVLSPCGWQVCVPTRVLDAGMGAAGCALYPPSPCGSQHWEHWFCSHSPVPCSIHPLPWAVCWSWGPTDAQRHVGAAFLPSPSPSAASQCYRGGSGCSSDPPIQSSNHTGEGCTHIPIPARFPCAVSYVGHLLPHLTLPGGTPPPIEEPLEAVGAEWEQKVCEGLAGASGAEGFVLTPLLLPWPRPPAPAMSALPGSNPRYRSRLGDGKASSSHGKAS